MDEMTEKKKRRDDGDSHHPAVAFARIAPAAGRSADAWIRERDVRP
ncbi:hypothetical protein ACFOEY_02065 [Paracandidimonas soli]